MFWFLVERRRRQWKGLMQSKISISSLLALLLSFTLLHPPEITLKCPIYQNWKKIVKKSLCNTENIKYNVFTGWKGKYMVQKHFPLNNDNKSLTSSVWWESTLKFSDKLQKGPTEASCVGANFQGILLITTFDLSQLFFWLLPCDGLQKKKRNHRSRSVPGNWEARKHPSCCW